MLPSAARSTFSSSLTATVRTLPRLGRSRMYAMLYLGSNVSLIASPSGSGDKPSPAARAAVVGEAQQHAGGQCCHRVGHAVVVAELDLEAAGLVGLDNRADLPPLELVARHIRQESDDIEQ